MSSIPVQVSLDATAVTGRVNSRGSQDSSETRRILYGLSTDMPTTQTWVRYFPQPGEPSFKKDTNSVTVNSIQAFPELVANGTITRCTSYMTIMAVPLIREPKPYCLGVYSVPANHSFVAISAAHKLIHTEATAAGVKVITFPGDGDSSLRSLQWGGNNECSRGFDWLTELGIPLECRFSKNEKYATFGMQDLLHNLKKARTNIKRTETKCLVVGLDLNR